MDIFEMFKASQHEREKEWVGMNETDKEKEWRKKSDCNLSIENS